MVAERDRNLSSYGYRGKATFLPDSYGKENWCRVTLLLEGGVYHAVYIPMEETLHPLEVKFLFEEAGEAVKLQHCRVLDQKQIILERPMSQRSTCALAAAADHLGLIDKQVRVIAPSNCTKVYRGEEGEWILGIE